MNIAVVTLKLSTHSGSRAPIELARAFVRRRHRVVLIVEKKHSDPDLVSKLQKEAVTVELVDQGLRSIPQVVHILKSHAIDLVSFHGNVPLFLGCKFSGVPLVRTYYGTQFDAVKDRFFPHDNLLVSQLNRFGNLYTYVIEKFLLGSSRRIVAISKYTRDEVSRLYRIPAQFCYLGTFSYESLAPHSLPKHGNQVTLLTVSRLVPYKRFHLLIRAVLEIRPTRPFLKLVIVGSTSNRSYANYLQRLSNSRIRILTDIPDQRLKLLYRQVDIYLSADRYLFFGLPILEAAAAGLPAVILNTCAASEVVLHKKTGYVVKDMEEMKKYLTQLIDNPNLRITMGTHAHQFATNFSWDKTAACYEKIFSTLLS